MCKAWKIVSPCLIVLNSVYLMHVHRAARDSICMQGVYNCTMSAAILTIVFHSVQAIQVSVTYSTPVCLLQGFYVALVYHSVSITYGGDTSIQKEASWIFDWVSLVQQVQKSGACEVCALTHSGLCFFVRAVFSTCASLRAAASGGSRYDCRKT